MKQSTWELWFLTSGILFACLFFVGTLEGSQETFPNLMWYFVPAIINLAVCVAYGLKTKV